MAFLTHLEADRGNSVSTRNARLAAVRSLFRYAALHAPDDAAVIQRVLAIPPKRGDRAIVDYLTTAETDTLLAAPDSDTWLGRRDHALLALAVQTGLRVSELTGLRVHDLHLGPGAHVRCHGKGRKNRITPLTRPTVAVLRAWLSELAGQPDDVAVPQPAATSRSPATPSSDSSPSTPPPARPWPAGTSPRIPCATAARWPCCTPAWTPP